MKLQHTNDPDNIYPVKSYIHTYRVIKIIKFFFLYFTNSCCFTFDGRLFCVALQSACASIKRTGKTPRQICCTRYNEWALKIIKFQRDDSLKRYNFLEEVLNYIRALVKNNIEDEI